ncbi:MAG: glycerophosphodiester phosphodiesterase [Crocinitomicaceae bacterium]
MNLQYLLMATALVLGVVSCSVSNEQAPMDDFTVFAHRGASGYELENTISAFHKAIELNAKAVELDVFKCASGEIVVFHDVSLERLSLSEDSIERLTISEINEVQLVGGEKISTLDKVLKLLMGSEILINIELKGVNTANGVQQLIDKLGLSEESLRSRFVISSFNWDELKQMRSLNKSIPIAVLTDASPVEAIGFAEEIQAIAINPNAADVSYSAVEQIHKAGFKVYPWTVNEPGVLKNLIFMGVDGVFSDFPDKAVVWSEEFDTVVV